MKKLLLNIVFGFFLVLPGIAQPWTACFNADKIKGCAPLTVTMNDCSGSNQIFYVFETGGPTVTSTTHTYTTPGLYTVRQIVNTGVGPTDDSIRVNYIEVLAPRQPSFTLDVCEGGNVILNITDDIDTDYIVSFTGAAHGPPFTHPPFTPIPFTYSDNLLKTISINPFTCPGIADDTSFYPLQSLIKPDISSVVVNAQHPSLGHITVNFNAEINQRYYLQQSINNTASYATIRTLSRLSGPQSIDLYNLNTQSNQYCYRLLAYDDCNPPVASEEICSIINIATAGNNQNTVTWTHIPTNVAAYQVYDKNYSPIAGANTSPYVDNPVVCGVNYCYTVIAQHSQTSPLSGPLLSISSSSCAVGTSTDIPPAVQNLNSTISGNSASLSWDNPVGVASEYFISRSVNGAAFTPYANYTSPITNTYTDNGVSVPGNTYCYMVTYEDVCGNISPSSNTTCPVILDVAIDNTNSMVNYLTWTPYTGGWAAGSQNYIIEKRDENNTVIETINAGSSLSYIDDLTGSNTTLVRYSILAVPGGPVVVPPYSNVVEIKYELEVYLPNAFTPNGDNTNDYFMAKGKFIHEFNLTVFNRWGEVVYTSNKLDEGWNGLYQNTPALNDVYAYLVEVKDLRGNTITKRGSVTLLR